MSWQNLDAAFSRIRSAIDNSDANELQDAVYELTPSCNDYKPIPDEIVERLLTMLRTEEMFKSQFSGYLLSFFQSEWSHLTARQKSLCEGFLNAWGDSFTNVHSLQTVAELREGRYLS